MQRRTQVLDARGRQYWFHYLYVNLQYTFRAVENFSPRDGSLDDARLSTALVLDAISHQGRARQHGMTFKTSGKWRNQTLEAEATGIFYARPNQVVIRSKIMHALSDRWRVSR